MLNENTAIFTGLDDVHGYELWKTDGTAEGTVLVKEILEGFAGSSPTNYTTFKNRVYFRYALDASGAKLWVTDGTAEGTSFVEGQDPNLNTNGNLRAVGDNLLFTADLDGWALYKTNGTGPVEKVKQLDDIGGSDQVPANSMVLGDKMYFSFADQEHGRQLWVTDGTSEGTKMIDLGPGESNPRPIAVADDQMYLVLYNQLYHLAGPAPLVEKMSDMEPSVAAKAGENIYFKAFSNDYGFEVFTVPASKFGQSIEFAVDDRKFSDGDFQLSAIASSGLNVTFSSTSQAITIDGTNVDVKAAGKVTIEAAQEGNGAFEPATGSATFCINPDKPQLTLNGNTITSNAATGNQWFFNGTALSATTASLQAGESGVYSVQVDIDGCKSEMSDNVTFTGLGDEAGGIAIYPNPVDQTLFVSDPGQLRIIDSNGRETLNQSITDSIDVKHLPPGIYIAIVNNTHYVKFVKQ